MQIGLISDTHSYMDERILHFLNDCNEIWHAGDWGSMDVENKLKTLGKPIRGVYGNIDGNEIREEYKEECFYNCENKKILITHIGGYPGRYSKGISDKLKKYRPDIFITGHSHIPKVKKDEKHKLLHLNPGACGRTGFHQKRTMMKFQINNGKISDLKLIELGPRSNKQ